MDFYVFKRHEKNDNDMPSAVIGVITNATSQENAREKLGLWYSCSVNVKGETRLCFKKSHRHKTQYFLGTIHDKSLIEKMRLKEIDKVR